MFSRMGEEKAFKIMVLFLVFAIIISIALVVSVVFRTCDEDYNPCSVCMQAGYRVLDPNNDFASIAFSPQDIKTVNKSWTNST